MASRSRRVHLRSLEEGARVRCGTGPYSLQQAVGCFPQGGVCAQELYPVHVQPLPLTAGVRGAPAGTDGELVVAKLT